MIRNAFLLFLLSHFSVLGIGQVGINSDGSLPDASAGLDIQFENKGLLIPRLTTAQRNAISLPAEGLVIFNTSSKCLNIRRNESWFAVCGTLTGAMSTLNCDGISSSGILTAGEVANGVSFTIPYVGGNGGSFIGETVNSEGVTGLTATLASGNLAVGNGTLSYLVNGTPETSGSAVFNLEVEGSTCPVSLNVNAAFVCGASFTDARDNETYQTVLIGSQCWMRENLKYLPSVFPKSSSFNSETLPRYYVYGYDGSDVNAAKNTANFNTYGVLYNWRAVMNGQAGTNNNPSGVQGVCPTGWHVPSHSEWTTLELAVCANNCASNFPNTNPGNYSGWHGTDENNKLRNTTGWQFFASAIPTNSSQFSALPGGVKGDHDFFWINEEAHFWTATLNPSNSGQAWKRELRYSTGQVLYHNQYPFRTAFSVRCVRD